MTPDRCRARVLSTARRKKVSRTTLLGARSILPVPIFGSNGVVPIAAKLLPFESDRSQGVGCDALADFVFALVELCANTKCGMDRRSANQLDNRLAARLTSGRPRQEGAETSPPGCARPASSTRPSPPSPRSCSPPTPATPKAPASRPSSCQTSGPPFLPTATRAVIDRNRGSLPGRSVP